MLFQEGSDAFLHVRPGAERAGERIVDFERGGRVLGSREAPEHRPSQRDGDRRRLVRDLLGEGAGAAHQLVYRHHTKPEFNLFGRKFRFNITTTDWMLNVVRTCTWWRKLPGWHEREQGFRDWYVALLPRLDFSTPDAYARSLEALKAPEGVTGYREVRYPKMDEAKQRVESLLTPRRPSASGDDVNAALNQPALA